MTLLRSERASKEGALPHGFYLEVIDNYSSFALNAQNFTEGDTLILQSFGLLPLLHSGTWLGEAKLGKDETTFSYRIRATLDTIPVFTSLLKRESEKREIVVETTENNKKHHRKTKRLTFIIRESEVPSLTLKDFATIAADIESLFQVVAKMMGSPSIDLVVSALDSGSEKSIEVTGIAGVIDKMSGFLIEAWNSVRFPKSSKTRATVKAASESLAFINEIHAARVAGTLTPEEAETLKRKAIKSAEELFGMGVYTTEMQTNTPPRPNQVELQRTKLITYYKDDLASLPPPGGESPSENEDDVENNEDA